MAQVRTVCIGQEIDVWVLGRTRIRFQVGMNTLISSNTILAQLLFTVSTDPPDANSAVLLTTNTEISIAPKIRPKPTNKKSAPTPVTIPNASDKGLQVKPTNGITQSGEAAKVALRALPSRLVNHGYNFTEGSPCALISPWTFAKITGNQALPHAILSTMRATARVRRLRPPFQAPSLQSESRSALTPEASKILTGLQENGTKKASEPIPTSTVPLVASEFVPEGHVVCLNLPGVSDWNIVVCVSFLGA